MRDLYRTGLEDRHALPGMVVSIQPYGDQAANWQPHLRALVSAGVFNRQERVAPLGVPPAGVAEELFRRRVIRLLMRRGRLEEDAAAGLLSWRYSGFSLHHAIRVEPDDTAGVQRLCRDLVHPPLALGRLTYEGVRAGYRGWRGHPLTVEASVRLDPMEMLARWCQHLPPPGFHLTRLYGTYANRTRGARTRCAAAAAGRCGSSRSSSDPAVIRKILQHRPRAEARAHGPPTG